MAAMAALGFTEYQDNRAHGALLRQPQTTVDASKTGPSTQTRFIAEPTGVDTSTVQPAQPPTAQAMNSSSDTWHGTPYFSASAATAAHSR